MSLRPGQSQPNVGSGSADPAPDPEEDDGSTDGSGSALVAPKDPKARATWLKEKLELALSSRPALAKVRIGIAVHDLATNTEVAGRDADKAFNLASNVKVLTGAAALVGLGGGFRWRTAV
ncbi:MAG: D-alanyl-D-alanine carboxypeptidase, partial [Deltaproteobacteria bacterium]|nr:D-alanyl-D-alanine carboxypeptidase [Deltaproteobacteria bacterium]